MLHIKRKLDVSSPLKHTIYLRLANDTFSQRKRYV